MRAIAALVLIFMIAAPSAQADEGVEAAIVCYGPERDDYHGYYVSRDLRDLIQPSMWVNPCSKVPQGQTRCMKLIVHTHETRPDEYWGPAMNTSCAPSEIIYEYQEYLDEKAAERRRRMFRDLEPIGAGAIMIVVFLVYVVHTVQAKRKDIVRAARKTVRAGLEAPSRTRSAVEKFAYKDD